MSERKFIIPEYGPFAGMRVVCSGSLVAMPFAATMLADFGAEVIQIERPGVGDTLRMLAPFAEVNGKKVSTAWAQNARNKLAMALELNLKFDEVKEIFYGLIKEADIFMENMVWLEKLGIYDEELLKVNPKLVIVHVSGMGHKEFGGIPSVCNRASYDMIGQAFSGWLYLQGDADRDPAIAKPYTNDYVSAFATVFAALSGYIYAQKTGKGQVIDASMYESAAYLMSYHWCEQLNGGGNYKRTGPLNPLWRPFGYYECRDGKWVSVGVWGIGIWKKFCDLMGVSPDDFPYMDTCGQGNPELVKKMDALWLDWLSQHDAAEVERIFMETGIPVSMLNTAEDAYANPHWQARNDFIKIIDATTGGEFVDIATMPRFGGTPCNVYKGAPLLGQESDAIMKEILGYSAEKIESLKAAGAVAASLTTK